MENNLRLYHSWRICLVLSSSLSVMALIPAIIDYEGAYDEDRTFDECKVLEYTHYINRWIVLALSLGAIAMLVPYKFYYVKWKRESMLTYLELPALRPVTFTEVVERCKRPTFKSYLDPSTIGLVIIYLILPYPYMEISFQVRQVMIEQTTICYYVSEVFLAVMFIRILLLALHISTFSKYQSVSAMRHCERYGFEPDSSFSMKCYLNEYPVFIVVFILIIPSVLIISAALRIFERPAHLGEINNLMYYENGLWNVIITMTTVGYGDVYPITIFGRAVSTIAAIWGGVVLSIMFATVTAFLLLEDNQKKAFSSIVVSEAATEAIKATLKHGKHIHEGNAVKQIKEYDKIKKHAMEFKRIRNLYGISEDPVVLRMKKMDKRLKVLEDNMQKFQSGMDQLLEKQ